MLEEYFNIKEMKNEYYILIAIAVSAGYLYYVQQLSRDVMMCLGGIALVALYFAEKELHTISFDEARNICINKVRQMQELGDLPRGTISLGDTGLQRIVTNIIEPDKWLVGYTIESDEQRKYMMTISSIGSVMSNDEKPEGWELRDEPSLIKIETAVSNIKSLPTETSEILREGSEGLAESKRFGVAR